MYLLLQTSEATPYSISLELTIAVGFAAAVTIGSIAWYNSKRPAGWEGKECPNIVPKIQK